SGWLSTITCMSIQRVIPDVLTLRRIVSTVLPGVMYLRSWSMASCRSRSLREKWSVCAAWWDSIVSMMGAKSRDIRFRRYDGISGAARFPSPALTPRQRPPAPLHGRPGWRRAKRAQPCPGVIQWGDRGRPRFLPQMRARMSMRPLNPRDSRLTLDPRGVSGGPSVAWPGAGAWSPKVARGRRTAGVARPDRVSARVSPCAPLQASQRADGAAQQTARPLSCPVGGRYASSVRTTVLRVRRTSLALRSNWRHSRQTAAGWDYPRKVDLVRSGFVFSFSGFRSQPARDCRLKSDDGGGCRKPR